MILTPKCASCHYDGAFFAETSDLILTSDLAYNQLLNRIPNLNSDTQVIIACGKSTDNTIEVAKSLKSNHFKIDVIEQTMDGKANAVWEAVEKAKYDAIAILDADISVDPEELTNFFEVFSMLIGNFCSNE